MDNTSFENKILEILLQHPEGITAKDIAKELGVTKGDINPILYRAEGTRFEKIPYTFDWVLVDSFRKEIERPKDRTPQATSELKSKESFNQTKALLNTFFNGNKALIEMFENMCKAAFQYGDPKEYCVYAKSLYLIGVAKRHSRLAVYIKKHGNSFKAKFIDDDYYYPFKKEMESDLLFYADIAFRSNRITRPGPPNPSESDYPLDYLSDKPRKATPPPSEPEEKKDNSIRLDYNTAVYVKGGDIDHNNDVKVSVYVVRTHGRSGYVSFYANKGLLDSAYVIPRDTYDKLRMLGTVCVQIYDYSKYGDRNLSDESVIAACGYTTSAESDLSTEERQCILDKVIENGFWTASHIASHLQYCIISHPANMYELNRRKWEADRQYIISKYINNRQGF